MQYVATLPCEMSNQVASFLRHSVDKPLRTPRKLFLSVIIIVIII